MRSGAATDPADVALNKPVVLSASFAHVVGNSEAVPAVADVAHVAADARFAHALALLGRERTAPVFDRKRGEIARCVFEGKGADKAMIEVGEIH